jgi:hypothetical protein
LAFILYIQKEEIIGKTAHGVMAICNWFYAVETNRFDLSRPYYSPES